MCGIADHVGGTPLPDERVRACLALMARRGPDAHGVERYRLDERSTVTLLHTRLSIIDPDPRGAQPMSMPGHHVALNGELYNYRELRTDLESRGVAFRTRTDTEVLLALLASDGWAALDRCEGMWAFAHVDEARGALVLCRDRFGEKPLYLHETPDGLVFGSEPKFVFALLGRTLPVDRRQGARYLVNGYKALYKQPATFFEGLAEVPAGGVRDGLARSVELRLRADVPLAFCMSGGIDSNCLLAIAKRLCGFDVHGFTIVNEDERYEERAFVDHMVPALDLRQTSVSIDGTGFLDGLSELVRYHDAPVYTISYYVH